jgi:hypothetical protein
MPAGELDDVLNASLLRRMKGIAFHGEKLRTGRENERFIRVRKSGDERFGFLQIAFDDLNGFAEVLHLCRITYQHTYFAAGLDKLFDDFTSDGAGCADD